MSGFDGMDRTWRNVLAEEDAIEHGTVCGRCGATLRSKLTGQELEWASRHSDAERAFIAEHNKRVDRHICIPTHLHDLRKRIDFNASEHEQLEALMNALAERLATPSA